MFIAIVLLSTHSISAFGTIGHWLSGRIAQEFLTSDGLDLVKALLPEYRGELRTAATWADGLTSITTEIKRFSSYRWASPLHFIDPSNDSPPATCGYFAGDGCVNDVCASGAIHNYTTRLMDPILSSTDKNEALKFLIHIIGDLHQPLHVTGRDRGGTRAIVKFDKRSSSMHSVWDSLMFEVYCC